ncbi:MAG: rhodanese-related sulfurtransferase [Alphaproteobacteria bacterium]|nr:rhodanese-related sulfurtransferase [Alphaproteobacteria bacterium]MDE2336875.1 rhodanese-related sulfurtransferase [Alphaproteobacteria bacterium]
MEQHVVAALYKFAPLAELEKLRAEIAEICAENDICGTLLLAPEGINGTVAGTRGGIDGLLSFLRAMPALKDLDHKESGAENAPFHRMKVRIKKEIVTIGLDGIDPSETVGVYVDPAAWNGIITDPETLLIDTRNDYEVAVGTFKGALNPQTETFREFPAYVSRNLDNQKHKKVAMFCTGGIRCEKASAYMKKLGFEEVYHLKGGILKYLETVPEEESLWQGECFVFDRRVAVKHGLKTGSYDLCPSCRRPVCAADKKNPKYVEGVACPHCHDSLTPEKKAAAAERHRQMKLAEARGEKHIGAKYAQQSENPCEGEED